MAAAFICCMAGSTTLAVALAPAVEGGVMPGGGVVPLAVEEARLLSSDGSAALSVPVSPVGTLKASVPAPTPFICIAGSA